MGDSADAVLLFFWGPGGCDALDFGSSGSGSLFGFPVEGLYGRCTFIRLLPFRLRH